MEAMIEFRISFSFQRCFQLRPRGGFRNPEPAISCPEGAAYLDTVCRIGYGGRRTDSVTPWPYEWSMVSELDPVVSSFVARVDFTANIGWIPI